MASCDVQVTHSQEQLKPKDDSNLKAITLNMSGNDRQLQPTKIPAPLRLTPSGSSIPVNNRRYTSLKSPSKSVEQTLPSSHDSSFHDLTLEDSGVMLDCSTSSEQAVRPSISTSDLKCSSQLDLNLNQAEQITLRELQRAVAEMEADVQSHADLPESPSSAKEEEEEEELAAEPSVAQLLDDATISTAGSYVDVSAVPSFSSGRTGERKMVRLEQLLAAQHNIELLHMLLQADNDISSDTELATNLSTTDVATEFATEVDNVIPMEAQVSPPMPSLMVTLKPTQAFTELPKKRSGILHSLLHVLRMHPMRKLGYPLLFCGMAVGMIYYYRKV